MSNLTNQRLLCTFPGRAGDLLWALPTVRAIAEAAGHPVDLQIAGEFEGMVELLRQQEYLNVVHADPLWTLTPPDDWKAPWVPREYDQVFQLGYRGWPNRPLPYETLAAAQSYDVLGRVTVDLDRPWITVADPFDMGRLVCGWSDCYFELKVGLHALMEGRDGWVPAILAAPGSRWLTEHTNVTSVHEMPWLMAAEAIAGAQVFLGDCSALHVLAVGLGKPVVIYEPMEARWNPIFYPLGMDGKVQVVRGNDGLPTFDARHTADALRLALAGVSRG